MPTMNLFLFENNNILKKYSDSDENRGLMCTSIIIMYFKFIITIERVQCNEYYEQLSEIINTAHASGGLNCNNRKAFQVCNFNTFLRPKYDVQMKGTYLPTIYTYKQWGILWLSLYHYHGRVRAYYTFSGMLLFHPPPLPPPYQTGVILRPACAFFFLTHKPNLSFTVHEEPQRRCYDVPEVALRRRTVYCNI